MKHKGRTQIELILVMLLLVLFGYCTYWLVSSSAASYDRFSKDESARNNIRLLSSYIDSRVKQRDDIGAVSLKRNPFNDTNAIVIRESSLGDGYETWIYFKDKSIYEVLKSKDVDLKDAGGFAIASIEGFEARMDVDGILEVRLRDIGKVPYESDLFINVRSE